MYCATFSAALIVRQYGYFFANFRHKVQSAIAVHNSNSLTLQNLALSLSQKTIRYSWCRAIWCAPVCYVTWYLSQERVEKGTSWPSLRIRTSYCFELNLSSLTLRDESDFHATLHFCNSVLLAPRWSLLLSFSLARRFFLFLFVTNSVAQWHTATVFSCPICADRPVLRVRSTASCYNILSTITANINIHQQHYLSTISHIIEHILLFAISLNTPFQYHASSILLATATINWKKNLTCATSKVHLTL